MDRVLVVCPTYSGKDYALEEYLHAYNNFSHKNKHLFMVDNSDNNYIEKLLSLGVDAVHVDILDKRNIEGVLSSAWRLFIKKALSERYDFIFSCEADNINPPETISLLLDFCHRYNAGIVAHDYPDGCCRDFPDDMITGLGCTMIRTCLFSEDVFSDNASIEWNIYLHINKSKFPIIRLSNILKTNHLKNGL